MIEALNPMNLEAWADLNHELWLHHTAREMLEKYRAGENPFEVLYRQGEQYAAFMSLALRRDYVEGASGSPTAYLEGIYVRPAFRGQGIARRLVEYARAWAREQGCRELASDCYLENAASRAFHGRVGFAEVGINVHFLQKLGEKGEEFAPSQKN